MKKLILICLVLSGCGVSKMDADQNEVILGIVKAHNQLVNQLYPSPTPTVKPK